ncbi:GNAT family N-acetyltransferase [Bradyrhizobium sp. NBAIM08]|uniref:GNAT family N-acetyltransferase n=1 Tax=Bradyrhizobium sp. NBAIM08 TaxID=2793815 RepID=UPI00201C9F4C|nr:GNAT family N-acetyltransferase [Bradyrhizobium sp. NBAIM08]
MAARAKDRVAVEAFLGEHGSLRVAGVGTALVEAVVRAAREAGCWRLWVVTTNDSVDALRFHQR